MRTITNALFAAVMIAAAPAYAATTVYQSTPDLTAAPVVNGYCSQCSFAAGQVIGGAFTLSSAATLGSVSFAVTSNYAWTVPTTVSIYNDNGATVGSQLFSQTFSTYNSNVLTGHDTAVANVSLGNLSLGSGSYLIFFTNPTDLAIPTFATGDGGMRAILSGSSTAPDYTGNSLYIASDTIGYQLLSGAVPEPASWALMIGGFGLVGATARRRKVTVTYA
jgi:hypothetical protein